MLLAGPRARRAGVIPGMTVNTARARVPGLRVLARDTAAEARALRGVAAWAWQFSDRISLVSQGLLLEVGGSLRLFGGFEALLDRLRRGLAELGYSAVPASAPTPRGAACLARHGRERHVHSPDALRRALAPLPLSLLDWEERVIDALHGMGVRRISDLLRLPRDGLARRFGAGLPRDLDRLLGRAPDPRPFWRPPDCFDQRLPLPAATSDAAGRRNMASSTGRRRHASRRPRENR